AAEHDLQVDRGRSGDELPQRDLDFVRRTPGRDDERPRTVAQRELGERGFEVEEPMMLVLLEERGDDRRHPEILRGHGGSLASDAAPRSARPRTPQPTGGNDTRLSPPPVMSE